jgi:hypothetical protein
MHLIKKLIRLLFRACTLTPAYIVVCMHIVKLIRCRIVFKTSRNSFIRFINQLEHLFTKNIIIVANQDIVYPLLLNYID